VDNEAAITELLGLVESRARIVKLYRMKRRIAPGEKQRLIEAALRQQTALRLAIALLKKESECQSIPSFLPSPTFENK